MKDLHSKNFTNRLDDQIFHNFWGLTKVSALSLGARGLFFALSHRHSPLGYRSRR